MASPPTGTWAAGPGGLAGTGDELADVLARVPTGRLVVLGEPGAGKTMLDGPARAGPARPPGPGRARPVPGPRGVLGPLRQDLRGWLAARS